MKKNKKPEFFILISNVFTVLVLLYFVFNQEWIYFFALSMLNLLTELMAIKHQLYKNIEVKSPVININTTHLKEDAVSDIAKHIEKQLKKVEFKEN